MEQISSESLAQLQEEVIALVTAWTDRGIPPDEGAMILAANTHKILAKLGFSLGQIVAVMSDGWRNSDGKL